jgi:nitrate/TMAO reductase-like tetraheme cytochrome c subunit
VLTLVGAGLVVGFVAVVGTQAMVAHTGTTEFCSTACHSMQWVAKEYRTSVHANNAKGVHAGCHDCHIVHEYPQLLFQKAKAGIKDAIGEMSGTIATEELFKKERLRMAKLVWADYQEKNSQYCRHCHQFSPDEVKKQKEYAQPAHLEVLKGNGTCVDCHKGIAHEAPAE